MRLTGSAPAVRGEGVADTIITVQGEHSAWYPAERATASAGVHAYGPNRDEVFSRAVIASDAVRNSIEALHDEQAGPVTWWSSDSVRVWSERPWNNEGKQLPPVFHAAIDFTAKFRDFEALARWVEAAAGLADVTVAGISWDLTDATRTSANDDVREKAVQDAVAKATVLARSIGLQSVTAVALADPGMLGDPSIAAGGGAFPAPRLAAMKSQAFDSAGAPSVALKPEEIAVAFAVDARFLAN
jgi:uncharacterized protein YggE